MSAPALTQEEVDYYASLNLEDPDEEELQLFSSYATKAEHEGTPAAAPSPPTEAAVALRRPSSAAASAGARVGRAVGGRCGVTDVLDKTDLVGGVAGMADAALQTRVVELPGRALSSTAAVQCFLNATHLYLQHNALVSLEGLELLQDLRVLVVHHNSLTSAAPLQELTELFYLDLGDNALPLLDVLLEKELPCARLRYLSLRGNPCLRDVESDGGSREAYVAAVQAACPALEYLDGAQLTSDRDSEGEEESEAMVEASPVAEHTARRHGSRRAHELMEAARAGGVPTASSSPVSPSLAAGDGSREDAGRPLSASVSASTSAKHATPLEREEERLVRQLQLHCSQSRPGTAAAAAAHKPNERDDTFGEDADAAVGGGVGDVLQLFQGLQYTRDVTQARQQRDLAAHWDDVSRVLQTAQGLQQDRRRRMHERLQSNTESYTATLQLLQRESYTQDLDRYRKDSNGSGGDGGGAAPKATSAPSQPQPAAKVKGPVQTPTPAAPPTTAAAKPKKNSVAKKGEKAAPKHVPKPPPPRK